MGTNPPSVPFPAADHRTAASASTDFAVELGAEICTDLPAALRREWLVTNGIGGYAFGTVAGAATRRYHGLLVAATRPPAVRTLVLSKLEERVTVRGVRHDLSSNLWSDGSCVPQGHRLLTRFRLERGLPVWRWELDECTIEKRIAMVLGENAVIVEYRVLPGSADCELQLEALVANRAHHALNPNREFNAPIEVIDGSIRVRLTADEPPGGIAADLWMHCPRAEARAVGTWWRNLELPVECGFGYDHHDALLHAATFTARMTAGQRVTFGASLERPLARDPQLLFVAEQARRQAFLASAGVASAPALTKQLVLASDQCVVRRPLSPSQQGWSIIAGYPWFADWSRDTMIALPSLLLMTKRGPAARGVLETYARHLANGLLPNRFPERDAAGGEIAEWNSADAPLLFIRAVSLVHEASPDPAWLRTMWPAMRSIVESYLRGTRHGIRVDPSDGLVSASDPGTQLTWMDAKVNGRVITPRMGKPVEINALWYEALCRMSELAPRAGEDPAQWTRLAERVAVSFARFWNPQTQCLFDVIDGPDGDDASLRPNQILAAGLEHTPLTIEQLRAVVGCVARRLLVPLGLRTLDPSDPRYQPRCAGDIVARDEAYHQGTVWPWFLSFFVRGWRRINGDASVLTSIRKAISAHLHDAGLGTVSEILDGGAPHEPRGCPAQAWSIAAALEIVIEMDAGSGDGIAGLPS